MTYAQILKKLQKMTPEQLAQKAIAYEGCSGNWDSIISLTKSPTNQYREGEEPGTERYEALVKYHGKEAMIACKKGQYFFDHDH